MQQVISGAMLALKLVSAYFLIVALFALKKPKPIPRANPKTRFACVIAARNEERVIGELVQSLLQQNYPKTLFDIYVMPNNCTDHTALAAIRAGAGILKPRGEVRCNVTLGSWIRPGTVSLPKGLWRKHTDNGHTANALVPTAFGDLGGQATFNDARVQVAKL